MALCGRRISEMDWCSSIPRNPVWAGVCGDVTEGPAAPRTSNELVSAACARCFVIWAAHSPAASLQSDSASLSGPGSSSGLSSAPLPSLISRPAPPCSGETRLFLHGRPTGQDAAPLAARRGKAALGRTKPGLIMGCHSRGEAGCLKGLGIQKSAPDKALAQMPVC